MLLDWLKVIGKLLTSSFRINFLMFIMGLGLGWAGAMCYIRSFIHDFIYEHAGFGASLDAIERLKSTTFAYAVCGIVLFLLSLIICLKCYDYNTDRQKKRSLSKII